jgi:hypothetical protein
MRKLIKYCLCNILFFCVFIPIFLFLPVLYTWLLMTDQQRLSSSCHHVHCQASHDSPSESLHSNRLGCVQCAGWLHCYSETPGSTLKGGQFETLSAVDTDKASNLNSLALVSHHMLGSSDVNQHEWQFSTWKCRLLWVGQYQCQCLGQGPTAAGGTSIWGMCKGTTTKVVVRGVKFGFEWIVT